MMAALKHRTQFRRELIESRLRIERFRQYRTMFRLERATMLHRTIGQFLDDRIVNVVDFQSPEHRQTRINDLYVISAHGFVTQAHSSGRVTSIIDPKTRSPAPTAACAEA
jgi:hypothetical protein